MNWTDQPVLVTGGSGFVGGHLAERLAAAGARVRAIVRRRGDHPGLGAPGAVSNIEQMEGDFVDPETARRACRGIAVVIHAAASIAGDLVEARRVNVSGTAGLAAAARSEGCGRFVHISTISVYDWVAARAALEAQGEGGVDTEFDETTPQKEGERAYAYSPAGSPWYGLTKAEAERALEAEMALGLPATILRLGAVLGVHPTSSWAVGVPADVRAGRVRLVADGTGLIPWTHVQNIGRVVDLAVASPAAAGRSYNVVDSHVTFGRYVEDVRAWFPDALPAPREAAGPGATFAARCSNERLHRELGYTPIRSYEDAMAEAAAWWRARG